MALLDTDKNCTGENTLSFRYYGLRASERNLIPSGKREAAPVVLETPGQTGSTDSASLPRNIEQASSASSLQRRCLARAFEYLGYTLRYSKEGPTQRRTAG